MKQPIYTVYDYLEDMRQISMRYQVVNDELSHLPPGSLVIHRHQSGAIQAYNHIWDGERQKAVYLNPRKEEAKAIIDALNEKKTVIEKLKAERAELESILRKNKKQ